MTAASPSLTVQYLGLAFWNKARAFFDAATLLARNGEKDAELRYDGLSDAEALRCLSGQMKVPRIVTKYVFSEAAYFLYARSLELGLKSFLESRGYARGKLKHDFSHDLRKLYAGSISAKIDVFCPKAGEAEAIVHHLDDLYGDKFLEFPDKDGDLTGRLSVARYDAVEEQLLNLGFATKQPKWISIP